MCIRDSNNVVKVWEQTTADVVTALQDNFDRYNPVSYTHLDVYKRQICSLL